MTTDDAPETPLEAALIRIATANAPDAPRAELLRVLRKVEAFARETAERASP